MDRFLNGRTALVTGSVQGIGLAIGEALASAGARIGVHGLASEEQRHAALQHMRQSGAPEARFFDADLEDDSTFATKRDALASPAGQISLSALAAAAKTRDFVRRTVEQAIRPVTGQQLVKQHAE